MFNNNKKEYTLKETDKSLYEILVMAEAQSKEIVSMIPKIEDKEVRDDLTEIHETVNKIISTISAKPSKKKKYVIFLIIICR